MEPLRPEGHLSDYETEIIRASTVAISVNNRWFLLTAGHILKDLKDRLDHGRKVVKSMLIFGFHTDGQELEAPYNIGARPTYFLDEGHQVDFAILPLELETVSRMKDVGIQALDESAWTELPESPDAYFLLGFPIQGTEQSITTVDDHHVNCQSRIGIPLLDITPTESICPATIGSRRFYAEVPERSGELDGQLITLTDINGMSGGPIFVVKRESQLRLRYWLFATQSEWMNGMRILAAGPVQHILESLRKSVSRQL